MKQTTGASKSFLMLLNLAVTKHETGTVTKQTTGARGGFAGAVSKHKTGTVTKQTTGAVSKHETGTVTKQTTGARGGFASL